MVPFNRPFGRWSHRPSDCPLRGPSDRPSGRLPGRSPAARSLIALAVSAVTCLGLGLISAAPARAQINVGITVSSTGPAAALGIPERNTALMLPTEIAGQKINYILVDDATDPSQATKNARRFVEENKVDLIIGSSTTPTAAAVTAVADETKTPVIVLAPMDTPPDKGRWAFRAPQHVSQMASALIEHMRRNNVKKLAFIGYADAYGESWLREMTAAVKEAGITIDPVERYNRSDTSVAGQVLKIVAANPDAVLVAGSGTPAALPQLALAERGFQKTIYQTHGAASPEYLRVGGKAVEGTILPVGPIVVANQLPASHPSKKIGQAYTIAYEEKYGAGSLSSFGGHMYDAFVLLQAAAPAALKAGKPGTPEFRAGLRDALERSKEVVGVHGVFNMTETDHYGHDARARVLMTVQNGEWKLLDK